MRGKKSMYLYIILSFICMGVANLFYKKSTAAMGAFNTTFYYYLFGFLFSLILWLIFREPKKVLLHNLRWPLGIALFLTASVVFFTLAVKTLSLSVASTIRSLSFVVTIILSVLLFKEQPRMKDYVAMVLAVAAILILRMK